MGNSHQVAVLVDAGYLFKAGSQALAGRSARRDEIQLDAQRAVDAMSSEAASRAPDARLLRIYWYDGSRGALTGHHLELAQLDDVKVRLGTLNSAGEQKQVDPLIITEMMLLAQKGAVSDLVLMLRTIAPTRGNTSVDLRHAVDTQAEWVGADLSAFLRYSPKDALSRSAAQTAGGADHASIVAAVIETLTPQELNAVATGQPGRVPGSVNHRLLGVARAANAGAMLGEPEKRALRKAMYSAAMHRFAAERENR